MDSSEFAQSLHDDNYKRSDLPHWFAGEPHYAVSQFVQEPSEALYACDLWAIEAESLSDDEDESALTYSLREGYADFTHDIDGDVIRMSLKDDEPHFVKAQSHIYFEGLTENLTFLGDYLGVTIPSIWRFLQAVTASQDIDRDFKYSPRRSEWLSGVDQHYENARIDIRRLVFAVESSAMTMLELSGESDLSPDQEFPRLRRRFVGTPKAKSDGPNGEREFWFQGRKVDITASEMELMKAVWDQRPGWPSVNDVLLNTGLDVSQRGLFETTKYRLNKKLKNAGLKLSTKEGEVRILGPDGNPII